MGTCGNEASFAHDMHSSRQYLAPELCDSSDIIRSYHVEADLWALGMLLYELLTLRPINTDNFICGCMSTSQANFMRVTLDACAHPLKLRQMASEHGLLHPMCKMRTTLPLLQEQILGLMWPSRCDKAECSSAVKATTVHATLRSTVGNNNTSARDKVTKETYPSGVGSGSLALPSLHLEELPDSTRWSREELQSVLKGTVFIPQAQLTLGKVLGHGTFAVVFRGEWRSKGKLVPVAVKKLHELPEEQLAAFSPRAQQALHTALSRKFCDEVKMLSKARHDNIVALHGLCLTSDLSLAFVMDLLDRSLFQELHPGGKSDSELAEPLPMSRVVGIARGESKLWPSLWCPLQDVKKQVAPTGLPSCTTFYA